MLFRSFQPTVEGIPARLRGKLEPAQLFHEVLDHRWYLSEAAGADVGIAAAVKSYVDKVLVHKPDEKALLPEEPGGLLEEADDLLEEPTP